MCVHHEVPQQPEEHQSGYKHTPAHETVQRYKEEPQLTADRGNQDQSEGVAIIGQYARVPASSLPKEVAHRLWRLFTNNGMQPTKFITKGDCTVREPKVLCNATSLPGNPILHLPVDEDP